MVLAKRISAKEVKFLAKNLVKRANKSLFVTMLMTEELKSPLSKSYHDLVLRKVKKDRVLVRRIGFGSQIEFKKLSKIFNYRSRLFKFCYLSDVKLYQRMLIRDKKEAIFAFKLGQARRIYFHTSYQPLVEALVAYFVYLLKRVYIKEEKRFYENKTLMLSRCGERKNGRKKKTLKA